MPLVSGSLDITPTTLTSNFNHVLKKDKLNSMLHSPSLKNPMQFYPTHTTHSTNLKWIEDEHSKISSDNIPPHRITFSTSPLSPFELIIRSPTAWIPHLIAELMFFRFLFRLETVRWCVRWRCIEYSWNRILRRWR